MPTDIDLSQFEECFFAECAEHIGRIEEGLLELESGYARPELLHAIFRAAHSVKGAAGTFGWTAIVRLTHAMEDLFDRMRSGRLDVSSKLVRLLLGGVDELKKILSSRGSGDSDQFALKLSDEVLEVVNAMRLVVEPGGGVVAREDHNRLAALEEEEEEELEYDVHFIPSLRCFAKGINPLRMLRELADFGMIVSCDLDAGKLPSLAALDPLECHLGWKLKLKTALDEPEIRTIFSLMDGDAVVERKGIVPPVVDQRPPARQSPDPTQNEAPPGRDSRAQNAQSIRVPSEKVDHLIDLTGELLIAYSMVNEALTHFTPENLPRLREAMAAMERGTRELQERVMSVRMLPASSVFRGFPRLVYDISAQTGKQMALQISGEDTELDKTVAEQLLDPLTHLIRNSADHGIENPEVRRQAGKPEQGLITLKASHQSGRVVIEIADDGKGLDSERIRAKAVARGLIAADADLSEAEVHRLIFAPGFSTQDLVTELSGRGVGMDVVKRSVEALNGAIVLESAPGAGTTIRLHLPLTLAVADGLLLRIGAQSFALPFSAVVESLRPKPGQLLNVKTCLEGGVHTVLVLRSESIPLVSLGRLFNIPGTLIDPASGLVVIVETGTRKIALLADDILGHQQFVIKSVEKNFRRIEGALGATILGDGTVALIIDVSALWDMHLECGGNPGASRGTGVLLAA